MRALLTSLLLCLAAFVASAECVSVAAPQVARVAQRGELVRAANAGASNAREGAGAFIKTGSPQAPQAAGEKAGGKRNDRRGSVMLLAALAIMSAIALRHAAASRR